MKPMGNAGHRRDQKYDPTIPPLGHWNIPYEVANGYWDNSRLTMLPLLQRFLKTCPHNRWSSAYTNECLFVLVLVFPRGVSSPLKTALGWSKAVKVYSAQPETGGERESDNQVLDNPPIADRSLLDCFFEQLNQGGASNLPPPFEISHSDFRLPRVADEASSRIGNNMLPRTTGPKSF